MQVVILLFAVLLGACNFRVGKVEGAICLARYLQSILDRPRLALRQRSKGPGAADLDFAFGRAVQLRAGSIGGIQGVRGWGYHLGRSFWVCFWWVGLVWFAFGLLLV